MANKEVAEYYDYTIPFYKLFWHKGTNAIHYGFWDDTTKSHTEALVNTNKVLAEIACITPNDVVLDAGCGVGGSSLWLVKNIGCKVVGITISEKQKDKALKYAREQGLSDATHFFVQDYTKTDFKSETFDVVWGLESVCYATNKKDFLQEAYRVLKPGGRVVVADGFLRRKLEANEESIYRAFLKGFALDNLASIDSFNQDLEQIGFKNIHVEDKSKSIRKTAQYMFDLSNRWFWLNKTLRALRLIPQLMVDNTRTGIVQKEFFESAGVYAVFSATK